MFETYAFGPIPPDDEIREAVLADRPRFEAKLAAGTAGLPESRLAVLKYEAMVADPVGTIGDLYRRLELGDFETVRGKIAAETARRSEYRARSHRPSGVWPERIAAGWADIFAHYGY
jgi:hypothetical protein